MRNAASAHVFMNSVTPTPRSCSQLRNTRRPPKIRKSNRLIPGERAEGVLCLAHAKTGASLALLGRWEDERSPEDDDVVQIIVVAGVRNQHYLQLWRPAA